MKSFLTRLINFLERLSTAFFIGGQDKLSGWLNGVWLAALYLGGLVHWGFFFNWGSVSFNLDDWTQTGTYFNFLRQAALHNLLPLHIGSTLISTDRYIARPDTLLSPQAYLLRFIGPGHFMLVNTLILFTAGCVGLLLLRKRYKLAPAAFGALFLMFNFNGHITAHLAVGHSEWVGYFLLPFFVLLVLKLVEGEKAGWGWVLGVSLTLLFYFPARGFPFFPVVPDLPGGAGHLLPEILRTGGESDLLQRAAQPGADSAPSAGVLQGRSCVHLRLYLGHRHALGPGGAARPLRGAERTIQRLTRLGGRYLPGFHWSSAAGLFRHLPDLAARWSGPKCCSRQRWCWFSSQ